MAHMMLSSFPVMSDPRSLSGSGSHGRRRRKEERVSELHLNRQEEDPVCLRQDLGAKRE